MKYFQLLTPNYSALKHEEEDELAHGLSPRIRKRGHVFRTLLILSLISLCFCAFTHWTDIPSAPKKNGCSTISLRREWRTLTSDQRQNYIRAVQCLKTRPSRLGLNHTLYDDFPWIHSRVGEYVHNAAPFLAWHRYFVHIYEKSLKTDCGYNGSMPYWNWSLDYHNVTDSIVFTADEGFGSNGQASGSQRPIVKGYCVRDGPFKDIEILYMDKIFYPHCLSRGFVDDVELKEQGDLVRPEAIDKLMEISDYNSFNLGLENTAHLAIPRSIRGDFSLLTAPSDPVFFLHHTQLDRLWWHWQSISPGRNQDYKGPASQGSHELANINDELDVGQLAPVVKVSEVLDPAFGSLCYGY